MREEDKEGQEGEGREGGWREGGRMEGERKEGGQEGEREGGRREGERKEGGQEGEREGGRNRTAYKALDACTHIFFGLCNGFAHCGWRPVQLLRLELCLFCSLDLLPASREGHVAMVTSQALCQEKLTVLASCS